MFGAVWTRFDTISLTANGGETIDPMPIPMSMNNGATPGGGHMIGGLWVDMGNQQHGLQYRVECFNLRPNLYYDLDRHLGHGPSQQFVGTIAWPASRPKTPRLPAAPRHTRRRIPCAN